MEYARHFVSEARTALVRSTVSAALPLARKSGRRDRVRDIMGLDADRRPATRRTLALAFVVMMLVAARLSLSNLWECPVANEATQGEVSPPPREIGSVPYDAPNSRTSLEEVATR